MNIGRFHIPFTGLTRHGKRTYDVARNSRLNMDWVLQPFSANEEIKTGIKPAREAARVGEQNDDYIRRYLQMVACNVVGTGFVLKSTVEDAPGKPDNRANELIERGWYDWTRNYCTELGEDWVATSEIVARSVSRDGDVCVLLDRSANNPYRFALRVIESDIVDETYNLQSINGGNRIVMGVELNQSDVPVAYHCWTQHPGDPGNRRDRKRIVADDMLLLFRRERPGQCRGVSWLASAIQTMNMLKGAEEAHLVGTRYAACKMAMFTKPEDWDGEQDAGGPIDEASPGMMIHGRPGEDVKPIDWNQPNPDWPAFMKHMQRKFAAGQSISYNHFMQDLENVNMSSMRGGVVAERDFWRACQRLYFSIFCRPVFAAWLKQALLTQAVPLPVSKYYKFRADTWKGRAWDWVDPVTDLQAAAMAVANKWRTNTDVIEQAGGDIDDVYAGLQTEQQAQIDHDLPLGVTASLNSPAPTNAEPASTGADNGKATAKTK